MHTCESVYKIIVPADRRSSLIDEDWIEREPRPGVGEVTDGTAAQRIREWRPQTTVNAITTTHIGFPTTSTLTKNALAGFGNVNQLVQSSNLTTIGFMTSREALSILPPEQLANADKNPRKRKADNKHPSNIKKAVKPQQTTLQTWFNLEVPQHNSEPAPRPMKVSSSGIIQDRGKAIKPGPSLPQPQDMSSPRRGYDINELPSLSFSSPAVGEDKSLNIATFTEKCDVDDDIPTSPLMSIVQPVTVAGMAGASLLPLVSGSAVSVSAERRSLGIRRGMKPWSSKK
jgi:hypothetical protein